MFGNLIANAVTQAGRGPEAGSLVMILSVIVIVPMLYYLRETKRAAEHDERDGRHRGHRGRSTAERRSWFTNPWRKPRFLQAHHGALPPLVAAAGGDRGRSSRSTRGRSRSAWQGFSLRWWTADPTDSLLHDAAMRTAMLQTFKLSIVTSVVAVVRWARCSRSGSTAGTAARRGAPTSRCCCRSWCRRSSSASRCSSCSRSLLKNTIPLGTKAQLARADRVPDLLSGHHRARAIALDRARVRGSGDGPRRHADARRSAGRCCRCSSRRSSRASR